MDIDDQPEAGPSNMVPGPTPYHETSQFLHWRYSTTQLSEMRASLNARSVKLVMRNNELEKAAQEEMGNDFAAPEPTNYLSVEEELLHVRFYLRQLSEICRSGFGVPEVVESTAMTYLKRFFLKNSVMEWHPKNILPTCLYLAAKTTNHSIPLDIFMKKFAKMKSSDILDTEFLLAQSLSFEFWTRGAEKALRGLGLDLQDQSTIQGQRIPAVLPTAVQHLATSRLTDLEFVYSPSQIAMAAWYLADPDLVQSYLDSHYSRLRHDSSQGQNDEESGGQLTPPEQYGVAQARLLQIVKDISSIISEQSAVQVDIAQVKKIDKRLKGCTNPEKIPGSAMYIKRKKDQELADSKARASKSVASSSNGDIFGDVRKPLSPRLTVLSPPLSR